MRWVVAIIALLATAPWPLAAQTAAATSRTRAYIVSRHDRQRDVTVTQLLPPSRESAYMAIGAAYECAGRAECLPTAVHVTFTSQGTRSLDGDAATVLLVVDGERAELASHHSVQRASGRTTESFTVVMSTGTFLQMARGKDVSYQVGGTSSRLTDRQLAALASLARRLEKAGRPDD